MATHSSIPAWRIPWTEKLGRLQSVGLKRVRLKWNNKHNIHNFSDNFLYRLYWVPILTYSSSTHWLFSPKVLADSSKNSHRFSLLFFFFLNFNGFAIYQNESATGIHVFPILNPPPSSLSIPSLWVVPVHQPQASSIVHQTWTGDSFHIWYYTCFNAILPNYPTLSLSHRVQKTVLYISVSFAVSYTGLLLPSF